MGRVAERDISVRYRFTIKECDEKSDEWFITALINERVSSLDQFGPLATRLKELRRKIRNGHKLTTCEDAVRIAK